MITSSSRKYFYVQTQNSSGLFFLQYFTARIFLIHRRRLSGNKQAEGNLHRAASYALLSKPFCPKRVDVVFRSNHPEAGGRYCDRTNHQQTDWRRQSSCSCREHRRLLNRSCKMQKYVFKDWNSLSWWILLPRMFSQRVRKDIISPVTRGENHTRCVVYNWQHSR